MREGGRQAGRQGGREGGRERGREGGRQGGREGGSCSSTGNNILWRTGSDNVIYIMEGKTQNTYYGNGWMIVHKSSTSVQ